MKNLLTIAFIVGLSMPALANNFSVVENVSFDGTITVVKSSKNTEMFKLVRHTVIQDRHVLHLY